MDSGPIVAARGEETAPLSVHKQRMLNDRNVYKLARVEKYVSHTGRDIAIDTDIVRLCNHFNLPGHILERVRQLITKAAKHRLSKGRTYQALIAAAILLACRETGIPRTIKELHEATNARTKMIFSCYKHLVPYMMTRPVAPSEEIPAAIFATTNRAGLSRKVATEALRMHEYVRKKNQLITIGKKPSIYAAALVFITAPRVDKRMTQRQMALFANTNEISLRDRIRDISPYIVDFI